MQSQKTVYESRWTIPIEPVATELENHALVVEGDRIIELLPIADARRIHADAERVELPRHVVMPGFVNAHTHAAMTLLRGFADDLDLRTWLKDYIWPAEREYVGPDFARDGSLLAALEMALSGTTCFADQYFFADQAAEAASKVGLRARIGIVVIDFPTAWASGPDEYLDRGLELHDRWKDDPRVNMMFAPHAPYTVSDPVLERVRTLAAELDLPVHMHVHETAHEVDDALTQNGERPLTRLDRLGLLGAGFAAVHMTQVDADDLERLVRTGTRVVHCPQSNLKLASGWCPVARLRSAGVTVALGTDGAASNNDLDMLEEMRAAALLAKAVSGDPTAVPAHAALRMATLDGAAALGLDDRIGSLAPGKSADFIAIDLDDPATTPVFDAASAVVYSASRGQVTDSWVGGRPLMRDRRLTHLDAGPVRERALHWARRISGERG